MYDSLVGIGRADRQPEVDELLAKIATLTTERDAGRARERDLVVERSALKNQNNQLNVELTASLKDCATKSAKLEAVMEELGAAKERAHRLELAVAGAHSQPSKAGENHA
jgi:chromosome segregation ATPase